MIFKYTLKLAGSYFPARSWVISYLAHVHGWGQFGFGAERFQQEIMSSVQAGLGPGVFDFVKVEALVQSYFHPHALGFGLVEGLRSEVLPRSTVCFDELLAAARFLGERWSSHQIDLTEVTFEIQCVQQILYQFSLQFIRQTAYKSNQYRAIFFATPKSQHSFGIVVLVPQGADLLCGDDWYSPRFVSQHI